jgi:hypothetical protein
MMHGTLRGCNVLKLKALGMCLCAHTNLEVNAILMITKHKGNTAVAVCKHSLSSVKLITRAGFNHWQLSAWFCYAVHYQA